MLKQTLSFMKQHRLTAPGDHVLVALSGGSDSCALLRLLTALTDELRITVAAAHFNHATRGEDSEEDEHFCQLLARKLDVEYVTGRLGSEVSPKGRSLEDLYRSERYRFLNETAKRLQANKIALGHHAQDQAETVLLHLIRGSGMQGLRGFLPIRDGKYIRPLMPSTRQQIKAYLLRIGQDWREDQTNRNPAYLRNRIRMELIPYLKDKYNPAIENCLATTADILRDEDRYLCNQACLSQTLINAAITEERVEFQASLFRNREMALQARIIKSFLESFSPDGNGFTHRHIESILKLIHNAKTGTSLSLPLNLQCRLQYDIVIIEFANRLKKVMPYEYPSPVPGDIRVPEASAQIHFREGNLSDLDYTKTDVHYFDLDRLVLPLTIRNRRVGDRMTPLGMKGTKKIKDLLIDQKIPQDIRDVLPLMVDGKGIVWVDGLRMSDRVKVTPQTGRVLLMSIQRGMHA